MRAQEVMELLRATGALLEGHFLLSSGLHSGRYVQCARLLQYPWHAEAVGRALAAFVRDLRPGAVVGPALGGILVAHEVARALGVRSLFAEREGERLALRRGFALAPGERVVVAEDVVTTGGSTLETAEVVAAQGGEVVAAVALVDRRGPAAHPLPFPLFALVRLEIETFPPEACPLCRAGLPLEKPGSRPR
ncbi:MAG: orotate phosphoribosyltransferase [Candidatus Bipolaricaulota bacterium]|nr:orotate phosphoribosyltransferase [Candidatus Bipolaricaulota bacterium]MCX7844773.1 orotate phosphoribosyltransferase [Candidatus Bipolaricaulota bacterium]MDW8152474.1 orotate phosphoribosyltransferase [Candidatus Bipolaricaulota bacterium]